MNRAKQKCIEIYREIRGSTITTWTSKIFQKGNRTNTIDDVNDTQRKRLFLFDHVIVSEPILFQSFFEPFSIFSRHKADVRHVTEGALKTPAIAMFRLLCCICRMRVN